MNAQSMMYVEDYHGNESSFVYEIYSMRGSAKSWCWGEGLENSSLDPLSHPLLVTFSLKPSAMPRKASRGRLLLALVGAHIHQWE